VSGTPVSEVKEILIDLDKAIDDSSLEHLLSPSELAKIKEERIRRGKMSGPNNSILNG
jgi:hypothetical protein